MPRKSNHHDSKNAETCSCGCCKWHSSKALRIVLAAMFILMVIAVLASIVTVGNATRSAYFSDSVLSFMGVVFLVVFAGWLVTFLCECSGDHWARHGYTREHEPERILKRRYAEGEISRKEYEEKMKHLNK